MAKSRHRERTDAMNGQQAPIPFDEAVAEGKKLMKEKDTSERHCQLSLGKLVAHIKTEYRDRTMAKFAKEIGIATCTLHRYHEVYEAWDGAGIVAPGQVSYAVMRELKDVPNRLKIVTDDPQITKREAQEKRREHEGKPKNKSRDKLAEKERWFKRVVSLANELIRHAKVRDNNSAEMRADLREFVEPTLLPVLEECGEAVLALAKYLERVTASTRTPKVKTKQHGQAAGDRPVVG
jgi:hypothetical protein